MSDFPNVDQLLRRFQKLGYTPDQIAEIINGTVPDKELSHAMVQESGIGDKKGLHVNDATKSAIGARFEKHHTDQAMYYSRGDVEKLAKELQNYAKAETLVKDTGYAERDATSIKEYNSKIKPVIDKVAPGKNDLSYDDIKMITKATGRGTTYMGTEIGIEKAQQVSRASMALRDTIGKLPLTEGFFSNAAYPMDQAAKGNLTKRVMRDAKIATTDRPEKVIRRGGSDAGVVRSAIIGASYFPMMQEVGKILRQDPFGSAQRIQRKQSTPNYSVARKFPSRPIQKPKAQYNVAQLLQPYRNTAPVKRQSITPPRMTYNTQMQQQAKSVIQDIKVRNALKNIQAPPTGYMDALKAQVSVPRVTGTPTVTTKPKVQQSWFQRNKNRIMDAAIGIGGTAGLIGTSAAALSGFMAHGIPMPFKSGGNVPGYMTGRQVAPINTRLKGNVDRQFEDLERFAVKRPEYRDILNEPVKSKHIANLNNKSSLSAMKDIAAFFLKYTPAEDNSSANAADDAMTGAFHQFRRVSTKDDRNSALLDPFDLYRLTLENILDDDAGKNRVGSSDFYGTGITNNIYEKSGAKNVIGKLKSFVPDINESDVAVHSLYNGLLSNMYTGKEPRYNISPKELAIVKSHFYNRAVNTRIKRYKEVMNVDSNETLRDIARNGKFRKSYDIDDDSIGNLLSSFSTIDADGNRYAHRSRNLKNNIYEYVPISHRELFSEDSENYSEFDRSKYLMEAVEKKFGLIQTRDYTKLKSTKPSFDQRRQYKPYLDVRTALRSGEALSGSQLEQLKFFDDYIKDYPSYVDMKKWKGLEFNRGIESFGDIDNQISAGYISSDPAHQYWSLSEGISKWFLSTPHNESIDHTNDKYLMKYQFDPSMIGNMAYIGPNEAEFITARNIGWEINKQRGRVLHVSPILPERARGGMINPFRGMARYMHMAHPMADPNMSPGANVANLQMQMQAMSPDRDFAEGGFTEEQYGAMGSWVNNSRPINADLMAGKPNKIADILRSAMSPLDENMSVYKGLSEDSIFRDTRVGKTLNFAKMGALQSITPSEDDAIGYTANKLLHAQILKGTPALRIPEELGIVPELIIGSGKHRVISKQPMGDYTKFNTRPFAKGGSNLIRVSGHEALLNTWNPTFEKLNAAGLQGSPGGESVLPNEFSGNAPNGIMGMINKPYANGRDDDITLDAGAMGVRGVLNRGATEFLHQNGGTVKALANGGSIPGYARGGANKRINQRISRTGNKNYYGGSAYSKLSTGRNTPGQHPQFFKQLNLGTGKLVQGFTQQYQNDAEGMYFEGLNRIKSLDPITFNQSENLYRGVLGSQKHSQVFTPGVMQTLSDTGRISELSDIRDMVKANPHQLMMSNVGSAIGGIKGRMTKRGASAQEIAEVDEVGRALKALQEVMRNFVGGMAHLEPDMVRATGNLQREMDRQLDIRNRFHQKRNDAYTSGIEHDYRNDPHVRVDDQNTYYQHFDEQHYRQTRANSPGSTRMGRFRGWFESGKNAFSEGFLNEGVDKKEVYTGKAGFNVSTKILNADVVNGRISKSELAEKMASTRSALEGKQGNIQRALESYVVNEGKQFGIGKSDARKMVDIRFVDHWKQDADGFIAANTEMETSLAAFQEKLRSLGMNKSDIDTFFQGYQSEADRVLQQETKNPDARVTGRKETVDVKRGGIWETDAMKFSKLTQGLSWKAASISMSSMGVYFSLSGLMMQLQGALTRVMGSLSDLNSVFKNVGYVTAFGGGVERVKNILGQFGVSQKDLVTGWKNAQGVQAGFALSMSALAAKLFTNQTFINNLNKAIDALFKQLSDEKLMATFVRLIEAGANALPALVDAIKLLAPLLEWIGQNPWLITMAAQLMAVTLILQPLTSGMSMFLGVLGTGAEALALINGLTAGLAAMGMTGTAALVGMIPYILLAVGAVQALAMAYEYLSGEEARVNGISFKPTDWIFGNGLQGFDTGGTPQYTGRDMVPGSPDDTIISVNARDKEVVLTQEQLKRLQHFDQGDTTLGGMDINNTLIKSMQTAPDKQSIDVLRSIEYTNLDSSHQTRKTQAILDQTKQLNKGTFGVLAASQGGSQPLYVYDLSPKGSGFGGDNGFPFEIHPEDLIPQMSPPNVKIDIKPEVKVDVKPDVKPDIKVDLKPDIKVDLKPEIKVDVKPDIKIDLKPEVKVDLKPDLKPDTKPDVKVDVKVDIKTDQKTDVKTDVKSDPKSDVKTDIKTDQKPSDKTDVKTEEKSNEKSNVKPADSAWKTLMGDFRNSGVGKWITASFPIDKILPSMTEAFDYYKNGIINPETTLGNQEVTISRTGETVTVPDVDSGKMTDAEVKSGKDAYYKENMFSRIAKYFMGDKLAKAPLDSYKVSEGVAISNGLDAFLTLAPIITKAITSGGDPEAVKAEVGNVAVGGTAFVGGMHAIDSLAASKFMQATVARQTAAGYIGAGSAGIKGVVSNPYIMGTAIATGAGLEANQGNLMYASGKYTPEQIANTRTLTSMAGMGFGFAAAGSGMSWNENVNGRDASIAQYSKYNDTQDKARDYVNKIFDSNIAKTVLGTITGSNGSPTAASFNQLARDITVDVISGVGPVLATHADKYSKDPSAIGGDAIGVGKAISDGILIPLNELAMGVNPIVNAKQMLSGETTSYETMGTDLISAVTGIPSAIMSMFSGAPASASTINVDDSSNQLNSAFTTTADTVNTLNGSITTVPAGVEGMNTALGNGTTGITTFNDNLTTGGMTTGESIAALNASLTTLPTTIEPVGVALNGTAGVITGVGSIITAGGETTKVSFDGVGNIISEGGQLTGLKLNEVGQVIDENKTVVGTALNETGNVITANGQLVGASFGVTTAIVTEQGTLLGASITNTGTVIDRNGQALGLSLTNTGTLIDSGSGKVVGSFDSATGKINIGGDNTSTALVALKSRITKGGDDVGTSLDTTAKNINSKNEGILAAIGNFIGSILGGSSKISAAATTSAAQFNNIVTARGSLGGATSNTNVSAMYQSDAYAKHVASNAVRSANNSSAYTNMGTYWELNGNKYTTNPATGEKLGGGSNGNNYTQREGSAAYDPNLIYGPGNDYTGSSNIYGSVSNPELMFGGYGSENSTMESLRALFDSTAGRSSGINSYFSDADILKTLKDEGSITADMMAQLTAATTTATDAMNTIANSMNTLKDVTEASTEASTTMGELTKSATVTPFDPSTLAGRVDPETLARIQASYDEQNERITGAQNYLNSLTSSTTTSPKISIDDEQTGGQFNESAEQAIRETEALLRKYGEDGSKIIGTLQPSIEPQSDGREDWRLVMNPDGTIGDVFNSLGSAIDTGNQLITDSISNMGESMTSGNEMVTNTLTIGTDTQSEKLDSIASYLAAIEAKQIGNMTVQIVIQGDASKETIDYAAQTFQRDLQYRNYGSKI